MDLPTLCLPGAAAVAETALDAPEPRMLVRSFIEQHSGIGPVRGSVGNHLGRASGPPGRRGSRGTRLDWHTVNYEVARWGKALLEADAAPVGQVEAVGGGRDAVLAEKANGAPSSGAPLSSMSEADNSSTKRLVNGRKRPSSGSGHSRRSGASGSDFACGASRRQGGSQE